MRDRYLLIALVALFVVGVLVSSSYTKMDPKTIVGIWLFDEGKGDTVKDVSGNGNDMIIVSEPEWVKGKLGMALEFDGVDDCAQVVPFTELRGGEISLSVWVKSLSEPKDYANVISIANAIGAARLNSVLIQHRGIDAGDPFTFWSDDGSGTLIGASYPEPELDEWYHLGLVQDGSNLRMYVNGTEIDGSPMLVKGVVSLSTVVLRIGANTAGSAHNFLNCIIDEVAVFNAALSESDIKRIMASGLEAGVFAVSPAGKLTITWAGIKAWD